VKQAKTLEGDAVEAEIEKRKRKKRVRRKS
jgi:hypothetical protein